MPTAFAPIFTPAGPCLIWSGLLVGSSVAAVAKFRTKDIPRADLLRVGREQFTALRRVEAGVAVSAVASVVAAPPAPGVKTAVGLAVAASLVQGFVLVPWIRRNAELKEKKEKSENEKGMGGTPHMLQVGLELAKLGACVFVASQPL